MRSLRIVFSLGVICVFVSDGSAQTQSFSNFGTFTTVEATNVGVGRFAETSFPWFEGEIHSPLPGWDQNLKWDWVATYAGFTAPEENPLLFSSDFTSTSTITANDDDGNAIGTLSMVGAGVVTADSNDDAVFVDDFSAQVYNPYVLTETYEVVGGTGIYENLRQDGAWSITVNGRSPQPLYTDQDSRGFLAANPAFQHTSTFVIEGQYEIVEPTLDLTAALKIGTIDNTAVWSPGISNDNLEMLFVDWQGGGTPWRFAVGAREDSDAMWGRIGWIEGEGDTWTRYSHDRANISADGLTMIFASDIPRANNGSWDLWQSTRDDHNSPWSTPENLESVNTNRSERAADLSLDELTLYVGEGFANFGPVRMSTRESIEDPWSEPVLVPGMEDVDVQYPTVSADELSMVYAISDGSGNAEDLWIATRESKDEPFGNHRELLATENIDSFAHFGPDDALYFVQNAIPGSSGWDIWKTGDELLFSDFDANQDGNVNSLDADRICNATGSARYSELADFNHDGVNNLDDLNQWLDGQQIVPGDMDFDRDVDFADFLAFSDRFGSTRRAFSRGDFNCDASVDFSDFLTLSANFGHGDAAVAPVPEPSSWGLVMVGVGLLMAKRRRSRRRL